jgi:DNA-binding response OmpR family regulator
MLDKQNGKDGLPHMAEATGVATAPAPATSLLVIEDDENISAALVEYFSRAGYTVTTAADGVAGVEAAIKARPDVVVLDLMLPKMDGLWFARNLDRRLRRCQSLC